MLLLPADKAGHRVQRRCLKTLWLLCCPVHSEDTDTVLDDKLINVHKRALWQESNPRVFPISVWHERRFPPNLGLANQPDTVRSPALSESRVLSRRSLAALPLPLSLVSPPLLSLVPPSLPHPTKRPQSAVVSVTNAAAGKQTV